MSEYEDKSPFYRQYDLEEARRVPETREPAPHQMQALESLHRVHRKRQLRDLHHADSVAGGVPDSRRLAAHNARDLRALPA